MLLKLLQEGLGRIVLFVEWLTRPAKMQRDPAEQAQVDEQVAGMRLYQFYACPLCIKTRRAMHRLNLPIETRDVGAGSPHRSELEAGGGRIQVPCLYFLDNGEERWMYESGDIIRYLEERFGGQTA